MVIMAAVGATTQDKMLMVSLSECQTLITSLKKQFSLTKSYCPKKKKCHYAQSTAWHSSQLLVPCGHWHKASYALLLLVPSEAFVIAYHFIEICTAIYA